MAEIIEMKTLTIGDVTFEVVDVKARSKTIKIIDVTLEADKWAGTESPYSQVVNIAGVTENSQVDLTPSSEQLAIFHEKDLGFVTENKDGVVTVYVVGQKPQNDYYPGNYYRGGICLRKL